MEIIIAIIGAVGGGGGVLAYLRYFRKDKAEAKSVELANAEKQGQISESKTDMTERLKLLVETKIKESLQEKQERSQIELKAQNLQLQLTIEQSITARMENRFKEVFLEMGAARQREEDCLKERDSDRKRILELEIKAGI